MKLLYKFPTRERPNKFFESLENIVSNATHPDYCILVSADNDDQSMSFSSIKGRLFDIMQSMPKEAQLLLKYGKSSCKVEAINRDMDTCKDWDIVLAWADDMRIVYKGFDSEVVRIFEERIPNLDGLLHTYDGVANERLPTLAIMGRPLYDWFGYIYNPIYKSVACDNEQFEIVRMIGKYYVEPRIFVRHMHPVWGLSQMDELYRRNENPQLYQADLDTLSDRRSKNFGL